MVSIPVRIRRKDGTVKVAQEFAVGMRVRVRQANAYGSGMAGHIGTVERVGHEVVEVRLDMEPTGTTTRDWPFDKDELEVLNR